MVLLEIGAKQDEKRDNKTNSGADNKPAPPAPSKPSLPSQRRGSRDNPKRRRPQRRRTRVSAARNQQRGQMINYEEAERNDGILNEEKYYLEDFETELPTEELELLQRALA